MPGILWTFLQPLAIKACRQAGIAREITIRTLIDCCVAGSGTQRTPRNGGVLAGILAPRVFFKRFHQMHTHCILGSAGDTSIFTTSSISVDPHSGYRSGPSWHVPGFTTDGLACTSVLERKCSRYRYLERWPVTTHILVVVFDCGASTDPDVQ